MSELAEFSYRERFKRSINPRRSEFYKRAAAGSVLATAVVNIFGIHSPAEINVEPTPDQKVSYSDPDTHHRTPGEIAPIYNERTETYLTILQPNAPDFVAAPLAIDAKQQITGLASDVREYIFDNPGKTITIDPRGFSSDESYVDSKNGNADLGVASDNNIKLAEDYVAGPLSQLQQELQTEIQSGKVNIGPVDADEVDLNPEQIQIIDSLAEEYKQDRETFLFDYNYAQDSLQLSPDDKQTMVSLIDKNRGASFEVKVNENVAPVAEVCDDVYQVVTTPGMTHERVIPGRRGWHVDIVPGFIPPLFKRRRKTDESESEVHESLEDAKKRIAENNAANQALWASKSRGLAPVTEATSEPKDEPERVVEEVQPEQGAGGAGEAEPYVRPLEYERSRYTPPTRLEMMSRRLRKLQRERAWRKQQRLYDTPRERLTRRATKLAAGAAALIAIIPSVSFEQKDGKPTPPNIEECAVEETNPGYRTTMTVSPFLIPDLIDNAFLGDRYLPPEVTIPLFNASDTVTRTVKEHREIQVDEYGAVISEQVIPEQKTITRRPAQFEN